jgi:hypothetical protein
MGHLVLSTALGGGSATGLSATDAYGHSLAGDGSNMVIAEQNSERVEQGQVVRVTRLCTCLHLHPALKVYARLNVGHRTDY